MWFSRIRVSRFTILQPSASTRALCRRARYNSHYAMSFRVPAILLAAAFGVSLYGAPSVLDFVPLSIDGKPAPLAVYKGKVLMIVNVASHSILTPQYEGLEWLYETYQKQGLVVLAFPANNFGQEEPGSNQ